MVFQDFRLFSFTLGQNVAASRDYEEEKVRQCCEKAGLTPALGLDTYLYNNFGENGMEISGGEAQKIALARALSKSAPFLVLDEPATALDPAAEYEIYSKFNEIAGEKTALFISYRLSSFRFCDEIAVFEEGCIVQRGNHEELLGQSGGMYERLWQAQAQYYAESAAHAVQDM